MKRIIAGGTGFIGQALIRRWQKDNIPIAVIGRDKSKIQRIFSDSVTAISWEDFDEKSSSLFSEA